MTYRTFIVVGATVLSLAGFSTAQAANLKTYLDNKAAFLADTGAASATGVLPDAGRVLDVSIDPLGSYTLGSVTFALTVGSDNVAVGASGLAIPDWYPEGAPDGLNDIALGFERMQVSTSGPVYAFGFDFIEPDTTIPSWGGTPEESTYELLLFDGPALVGQVQFLGTDTPNDVNTFLGVWSDTAFDRVLINDLSGNDDDEYFGEFYTGTAAYVFSGITGCVQVNGAPLVGAKVQKMQNGPLQKTTTDAAGCYGFSAVSGKKFKVQIQGPVIP